MYMKKRTGNFQSHGHIVVPMLLSPKMDAMYSLYHNGGFAAVAS